MDIEKYVTGFPDEIGFFLDFPDKKNYFDVCPF